MCHKRFDRPSTLRKHLLVHTGEKAFQCETCGRRFGVASNLNRHVRRCILKPVNTMHSSSAISAATADSSPEPTTPTVGSPSRSHAPCAAPRAARAQSAAQPHKRRRRAPSPSRWIPESLRGFVLEGIQKTTSVPLPPVNPSAFDERDSWDENVGNAPYHPREWIFKPRLPGPGINSFVFGGQDVRNIGGGGGREQILGRIMVF
ncbi:hypothetical protein GYMLUDRAFT_41855 [Collybiopsis luxurians FD-317 M1]|uniref:C2H2-type domain-containing protein n=1 Tax=Collybiopsis luxurians FD-317 M1 TaxID=944289 RepID=A0A0D0BF44_9AGAR|nr:hypothetical protein GYMLUDRAFT_41855 [Collybiopsis luxurians FD-317 M1]